MGVPSGGFWALSGLLPVKPLADVMANYTRHDRNTKGNYVLHTSHLLPDGRSRHPIITQGGAFVNEQTGTGSKAAGADRLRLLDPTGSSNAQTGGKICPSGELTCSTLPRSFRGYP